MKTAKTDVRRITACHLPRDPWITSSTWRDTCGRLYEQRQLCQAYWGRFNHDRKHLWAPWNLHPLGFECWQFWTERACFNIFNQFSELTLVKAGGHLGRESGQSEPWSEMHLGAFRTESSFFLDCYAQKCTFQSFHFLLTCDGFLKMRWLSHHSRAFFHLQPNASNIQVATEYSNVGVNPLKGGSDDLQGKSTQASFFSTFFRKMCGTSLSGK